MSPGPSALLAAAADGDVALLERVAVETLNVGLLDSTTLSLLAALSEAVERRGGRPALPLLVAELEGSTLLPLGREGVSLVLLEVLDATDGEPVLEDVLDLPGPPGDAERLVAAMAAADVLLALAGSPAAATHLLEQAEAALDDL